MILPVPSDGCRCGLCEEARARFKVQDEMKAVKMDLVRMTARNIELGVKVQELTTELKSISLKYCDSQTVIDELKGGPEG